MKVLDIDQYAVTKLAIRIMLLKHLGLETAIIWPFICYLLYLSISLHCHQYFSEKTTSQMIGLV